MAVDITPLFRASVKTVKTRNKALGLSPESSRDELLRRGRPRGAFSARAKDVAMGKNAGRLSGWTLPTPSQLPKTNNETKMARQQREDRKLASGGKGRIL